MERERRTKEFSAPLWWRSQRTILRYYEVCTYKTSVTPKR